MMGQVYVLSLFLTLSISSCVGSRVLRNAEEKALNVTLENENGTSDPPGSDNELLDEGEGNWFRCPINGRRVPIGWTCDGDDDCHDGSDEADCESKTNYCDYLKKEGYKEFRCAYNNKCIWQEWQCDGFFQCDDKSDEKNCKTKMDSCSKWKFHCGSGECIWLTHKCDGDFDCKDQSDEVNCNETMAITTTPKM